MLLYALQSSEHCLHLHDYTNIHVYYCRLHQHLHQLSSQFLFSQASSLHITRIF